MPQSFNRRLLRWLALSAGAIILIGATPASHTNLVTVTPQGTHLLGNPAAKVKLTEYISYT